jgi:hypothetical protein
LGGKKKKKVMFWAMKKKRRLKRMESGEMCVSSLLSKSTSFAKILENVAQISDIQNWEKKKR